MAHQVPVTSQTGGGRSGAGQVVARVADRTLTLERGPDDHTIVQPTDTHGGDAAHTENPGVSVVTRSGGRARYRVITGDRQTLAWAVDAGRIRWVFLDGDVFQVEIDDRTDEGRAGRPAGGGRRARARGTTGPETLSAPMPATVVRILASPGQHVTKGESLILLEAMKMELPLRAPHDAVVASIPCQVGDLVQPDMPLVELEQPN